MTSPAINGVVDHSDQSIKFIFENDKEHFVKTCASVDYSNNTERGEVPGNSVGPVALTPGKASPTWAIEISKTERAEIVGKMGHGYEVQEIEVVVTYRRKGLELVTDTILSAALGGATKSASGEPANCSMGGKCLKVLENGFDPFDRNASV